MFKCLLLPLCALLLFSCDQKSEQPAATTKTETVQLNPLPEVTQKPLTLLKDPLDAVLVETAAEAIPTWRKFAKVKPTLVLLSQDPFLTLIPAEAQEKTRVLVHNGTLNDIKTEATTLVANPTFLPNMALSAALDAGFFSRVVWVLPQQTKEQELSFEILRKQLIDSGIATQQEVDLFTKKQDTFSGKLHGTPLTLVSHRHLKKIQGPVLVHIDLSFFKSLYINEIKTPLHPLIYDTLKSLRKTQASTLATTISQNNREGQISLQVRFIGDLLVRIFHSPAHMDSKMATNDARRSKALYLANFLQKEKIRKIYLNMEQDAPEDATVKYDLYLTARQFQQGDQALNYLSQAVKIDPGYAVEYEQLAMTALKKGQPEESLRMLSLTQETYPADPFLKLRRARLLAQTHQQDKAKVLYAELTKAPWSPLYYPNMPDVVRSDLKQIQQLKELKPTNSKSSKVPANSQ